MIERQHRILKDKLISRATATGHCSWMDHLPFVLLGMRSSIRADSGCAPADLVYGSSLRLPGDLLSSKSSSASVVPAGDFVAHLHSVLRAASPMPVSYHGSHRSRVDPALAAAMHVFLRVDAVRRPLVPPYDGPFPVTDRTDKFYQIKKENKLANVSVDRLKPAFFLPVPSVELSVPRDRDDLDADAELAPAPVFTRSGRLSRPPTRL